ncbi:MAG TPA: oligosaccharide flippase family protein [Catalimonadaceae bacterium]|nr:oligosaccharide flippase family protein [Catalimonadaceae bacterium]
MAEKPKSLTSLFFIYSIGNISSRLINFALVFLTTFYLTREEVGNYDLLLVTISLVTPLVTLQLTDAVLRWLLEDHSDKSRKDIISSISIILVGSFFLLGITLLVMNLISPIPYSVELFWLILLQSVFLVNQQFVRGIGDNRTYVASGIWYSFLYAILAFLALSVFELKVQGMIYANILAILFINLYVLVKNNVFKYFSVQHIQAAFIKKLLQYSLPLIPNSLSWWAISSLNRYLILFFLGVSANGLFAISYKIPTVLVVFNSIFNLSWQEKAITTFDDKNKSHYYGETHDKYLNLIFGLGLMVVATNKLLLQLMVGADFQDAWRYTPLLIVGVVFSALSGFFGSIYLSEKKTTNLLTSSIIGGVVTTISAYISLPLIGLQGASLSVMLGYLVLYSIRLHGLRSRLNIRINLRVLVQNLLLIGLISIISYSDSILIHIGNITISLAVSVWINKAVLRELLSKWSFIKTKPTD